ncbi:MAG: hypothetical protein RSC96_01975 [Oscillospiraceae bacterium]
MEFKEALLASVNAYPLMQPQDIVKLAYQSEYGGGHLISDIFAARTALMDEWQGAFPCGTLFEDISGGFCRLYLGDARERGLSPSTLFRIFISSAKPSGSSEGFYAKLDTAKELALSKMLPVAADALDEYINTYKAKGCSLVSHSGAYHTAYRPAYRIVSKAYCRYLQLFIEIDRLLSKCSAPIIGIDGNAAAGKTTLSKYIAAIYPCNVIHADSFFLPPQKRTQSRLSEAGGNIDYERLQEEVLCKLPAEKPFSYRIFSCAIMDFVGEEYIQPMLPVIVEGSYALHPYFKNIYNLRVFVSIDAPSQAKRIEKRNGAEMLRRFTDTWIPMEQKYFDAYNIPESCDLVF